MIAHDASAKWIRNAADERAFERGCRFDEDAAHFAVQWIERYCRLYEGESAGEPLTLRDWQLDATLRIFGWIRWSERWNRWVRRFRQASIWIAKKNKKSPTLAAWGLYLLCGDGEQGQKVFLAAKDGKQAREIAGKHAIEMVQSSPELRAECSINLSCMRITHEPTRSIMQPLSSSNSRTQQSKEGLNGCILIDETHIVDREFVNRISRAGISRSEPIHIEVSTAGNNPDGYGFERFKYAQAVESGTIIDDELLTAIYAAPQDLSDEALAADPLKFGRMANPAFGHTVEPDEFLRDYERSRSSVDRLAEFKMYRLNVWQRASNPWLSQDTWNAGLSCFTESDCEGLDCWAGLDLSLTRDMSAFALAFRDEELVKLLVYFWLPQSRAEDLRDKASYTQWAEEGHLRLIPGDTIDHNYLKPQLAELIERFRPVELVYDKKFAEQLTADLEDETGVDRIEFAQTPLLYTTACGDFERFLLEGRIKHNGNLVLSWQAGHVCLDRNPKTNLCRPVKPKTGGDHLTIDGIAAAVMATSRAVKGDGVSAYDSGESLSL